MKTESELKEIIKKSKRPCGSCGEVDTMLFCCECLREIREKDENKRNIEVKQAILDFRKNLQKCGNLKLREVREGEEAGHYRTNAYLPVIDDYIYELLQKLGLEK